MDDAIAVLNHVGSERAAFFSFDEGAFIGCLLAASHPTRISHLMLLDPAPSWTRNEEITWEWSAEHWQSKIEEDRQVRGSYEILREEEPNEPERALRWEAKFARQSQSPGAAAAETRKYSQTDVRQVLPSIPVPALVVYGSKRSSESLDVRSPRYVAEHIPNANFVEVEIDHFPWAEGREALCNEIEEFLTGTRSHLDLRRILTTVLFTDIVGSTEKAVELGDAAWSGLVAQHQVIVRDQLARFRGHEVDTAGDGFFAIFDGPARAVSCALAISETLRTVGIEIRAGVHTGEVELDASAVRGIAVHVGARVAALADGSEVLVTSTVKDLVVGSGLAFEEAGEHELKGVPDRWRLYRVVNG